MLVYICMAKHKKDDDSLGMDPITLEILKSLLANPQIYNGHAGNDYIVIQTAVRIRKLLVDEGHAPPVSVLAKD